MFTTKNAVMVALMQIWAIVGGVLAAGVVQRVWKSSELPVPGSVIALTSYGIVALAGPLVWIGAAAWVRQREDISDRAKSAVFALGILMLLVILASVGYAVISPWFHWDWRHGATES